MSEGEDNFWHEERGDVRLGLRMGDVSYYLERADLLKSLREALVRTDWLEQCMWWKAHSERLGERDLERWQVITSRELPDLEMEAVRGYTAQELRGFWVEIWTRMIHYIRLLSAAHVELTEDESWGSMIEAMVRCNSEVRRIFERRPWWA